MPASPTIQKTLNQFSLLKDTINMTNSMSKMTIDKKIFMYPIIVMILLLFIKPNFIIKTDYTSHSREICIRKLLLWFVIFQIPLLYVIVD